MKQVTIGGGQGFWGDSNDAAIYMVREESLDYMACDYLAELTLSIMQKQKMHRPETGYARDFISLMQEIGQDAFQKGTKIITNAGGVNVKSCINELKNYTEDRKMKNYKIGYVLGDDILEKIETMQKKGVKFENMDTGEEFSSVQNKMLNANVYFGHEPIKNCLEQGADIVVTGRATDSALFLAPFAYEFGWQSDDYSNLAKGIMAGHLLECGGQGSGGNFQYDWRSVPDMDQLGFPIAKITDKDLIITKAKGSGGLISPESVKEQFLYEIHDPANYVTPDVTVDVSNATITSDGNNRVKVDNIKGKPRPEKLKVNIGYHAGWRVVAYLSYAWPDAYEKAQYAAEIIKKKMKRKGMKVNQIHVSYLGLNALHLQVANMDQDLIKNMNEVVLRIAVMGDEKSEVEKIIPELAPLQLNGPPGASFFGGRAKATEVIALWPTLIPRDSVKIESNILEVD